MNLATNTLNRFAMNPWFVVIGGVSSIAGWMGYLYDKFSVIGTQQSPSVVSTVIWVLALILLIIGYIYSIKVRTENSALREIAKTFCSINEIYKDTLQRMFACVPPTTDPLDLLKEEEQTLKSVCQRIENIFSRITNRNCLVTVKLVTNENGVYYASTYVRSLDKCERDNPGPERFKVDAKDNCAFIKAIQKRSDGKPPHFFSPNLNDEIDYSNARQHYIRHYKSAIVVPIMGEAGGSNIPIGEPDLIGYLSVDTLSANRLNNGYHLYMMSSLASQMYNFMSLMRGKYSVNGGEAR